MLIAIKKDDTIAVGASCADIYTDFTSQTCILDENVPFWKVRGEKDCYIASSSLEFAVDLMRYNNNIFKGITDAKSIISNVVPKMKDMLGFFDLIDEEGSWNELLLVIKGDKMFLINSYFFVEEIEMFGEVQGKRQFFSGAFEKASGEPVQDVVSMARAFNALKGDKVFPLTVFDTKTKKKKVFYK